MRSYFHSSSSCFIGVSKHLETIKALLANDLVLSIVSRCLDTTMKHALSLWKQFLLTRWQLTFHDHIFNAGLFVSVDFFNFGFVSEGFSLSFDQVFVQGLAGTNRSVAQYYLKTSNDDDVYVTITKAGETQFRVKFANLLFMNLNYCLL